MSEETYITQSEAFVFAKMFIIGGRAGGDRLRFTFTELGLLEEHYIHIDLERSLKKLYAQ